MSAAVSLQSGRSIDAQTLASYKRYAGTVLSRLGSEPYDKPGFYASADVMTDTWDMPEKEKFTLWYVESVLHALNSVGRSDKMLLRCYAQICEYRGRLGGLDREGLGDIVCALRAELECALGGEA